MSSFLKSIFHSNRHKKLCEEWTQAREPVIDGVTFYVRYLGSSLVEDPKSASSTAAGVKRIIHSAKAGARRPERVSFRVGMDGVKIDSTSTGRNLMDTSIYKISYCSADSQYDQVLAFVASNEDETCECHAFLCSKRKVAEAIAVSIAQAFTMAYECWKFALEAKRNGGESFSSEQASNTTGGSSPCRDDSKDMSRGSSPGHSPSYSSPSEVSSTSGYQSSTPGGLLLEFEELNCEDGTDHALNRQCSTDIDLNRVMPTADRKHWTSFDDLCDLEETFNRLSSDQARLSHLPWETFTGTRANSSGGAIWLRANPHPPQLKGGLVSAAKISVVQQLGTVHSPAAELTSPTAASLFPTETSCWPACNDKVFKINGNNNCTDDLKTTNTTNKSTDVRNFTNSTNNATRSSLLRLSLPKHRKEQNNISAVSAILNSSQKVEGQEVSYCSDSNTVNLSIVNDTKKLNNSNNYPNYRGMFVPRNDWESFDSSPPLSPTSNFFISSPYIPPISSPSNSFRSLSPLSAFLDSCLTPQIEDESKESKFMFSSRLSGDGRPFNFSNGGNTFTTAATPPMENGVAFAKTKPPSIANGGGRFTVETSLPVLNGGNYLKMSGGSDTLNTTRNVPSNLRKFNLFTDGPTFNDGESIFCNGHSSSTVSNHKTSTCPASPPKSQLVR